MIIDFNRYNGGGGSGSGVTPEQVEQQINSALTPYWDSAETQDAIDEAISGFTPSANSPIIPAITTQAEYEAISGDVKTGDLIQVHGVVLDGYDEPQYGLFGAVVEEDEEEGVVIGKRITWNRRDNGDSVTWSSDYPWMGDNGILPIDLGPNGFIISPDATAEDEAYNGIGFDDDGKPVITHIVPQTDEETGEITGITREDTPIGADMSAYYTSAQTEDAISAATSGKADAVNITENNNKMYFPTWTSQGVIKGNTGGAFQLREIKINNQSNLFPCHLSSNLPNIYAPTTPGTAGQILVADGTNTPKWSAVTFPDVSNYVTSAQVETQILEKNYITSAATADMVTSTSVSTIWKGTQAQYDAITTKDPNTFYIIVSN